MDKLFNWFRWLFAKPELAKPVLPLENASVITIHDKAPWMTWMDERRGWSETTHNSALAKYWKYAGHSTWDTIRGRKRAWCAMCINAALHDTGYKGNGRADAKSFCTYGEKCVEQYGCIVVIQHANGRHHVAFRGRLGILGGNQGDKISEIPLGNGDKIIACRWPVKAIKP